MFKNIAHKREYQSYGFVSLSLISEKEINRLRDLYLTFEENHQQSAEKFRGTGWIKDVEVVSEVNKKAYAVIFKSLEKNFTDFNVLGCSFLIKEPGNDSYVPPHQDWTYVDESKYSSMNVWIALENASIENGCLFFIPYSNRIGEYLRPSPSYPVPFKKISRLLNFLRKPVPLSAGECVCFNNKTIHGSYSNNGNSFRVALVVTLYSNEAKLLHHYIHDSNQPELVSEYEIDSNTFLNLGRGKPPKTFITERNVKTLYPEYNTLSYLFEILKCLASDIFK